MKPSVFDGRLRFDYLVDFQQFLASADEHASFHRWTIDLKHDVPLYRTVSSVGPKDTNGPDYCRASIGARGCPPVSYSRNLEGSISVRLLATRSAGSAGSQVPFYLQPTLGGSDINGQRLLSAYDDYRFRGPNLLALQESIEHSNLGTHWRIRAAGARESHGGRRRPWIRQPLTQHRRRCDAPCRGIPAGQPDLRVGRGQSSHHRVDQSVPAWRIQSAIAVLKTLQRRFVTIPQPDGVVDRRVVRQWAW